MFAQLVWKTQLYSHLTLYLPGNPRNTWLFTLELTHVPRATFRGVSRAAKTGQPAASHLPKLPWHGTWWAPYTSPHNAVAAPAPEVGTGVGTCSASWRGTKEHSACCLPGKGPQGQGEGWGGGVGGGGWWAGQGESGKKESLHPLQWQVTDSQCANKPPWMTKARGVRREPRAFWWQASEWGFGMGHVLPPCSSPPPPPASWVCNSSLWSDAVSKQRWRRILPPR